MTQLSPGRTAITLCGSLRKGSVNEILRRHMSTRLADAGVAVTDLSLADFEMPIFNEDLEPDSEPASAARLAEAFRSHDIVFIATPEYNGGGPPLVVNTIAWLSRQKPSPFPHAVFGIGGGSPGKYRTLLSPSHPPGTPGKDRAPGGSAPLRGGPSSEAFDDEGAPVESAIQYKVGQMVKELTHFSRGGI